MSGQLSGRGVRQARTFFAASRPCRNATHGEFPERFSFIESDRMIRLCFFLVSLFLLVADQARSEVTAADEAGFQIKITKRAELSPRDTYQALTEINRWWLKAHTYTGQSSNLAMDFDRGWFIENLPDGGYVRHMEIVFHQPGKMLRLTGGLGPLQPMGVHGAMTFELRAAGTATEIDFSYNVSGYAPAGLTGYAPLVDQVLGQQLDSLKSYCDSKQKSE